MIKESYLKTHALAFLVWIAVTTLSSLPNFSFGCIWDTDTLAAEAKGLPDVVDAIVGRIERNPPEYYQMRKDRVLAELASGKVSPEKYDDAAVANDRLGDSDAAIELMKTKYKLLMSTAGTSNSEHLYRYHANIGTFYAHRWVSQKANGSPDDLGNAEKHIAEAVRINPEAHFGREPVQLEIIRWLRNSQETSKPLQLGYHLQRRFNDEDEIARNGLVGLIALGAAWESLDVLHALSMVMTNDASIGKLAELRCGELFEDGKRSLSRNLQIVENGNWEAMMAEYHGMFPEQSSMRLYPKSQKQVTDQFPKLRENAKDFLEYRFNFMVTRLRAGRHPDTDTTFWDGYNPPPPVALSNRYWSATFIIPSIIAVLVGILAYRMRRRRKRLATSA